MILKKLDIHGFKSFADKICLEFHDGITSVVGPNGSGKSNISDSIRWVLGEQSAKSLRGGKMEDVIFAGTEFRKPMGYAEVSLTINNETKILPLEYAEVTITRRVYRSGESEFLINKTPCRLKDIHELFMDTGIGRDGYSVIGQGRVDEILSTRSEDRRAIFEEASGIMKYKVRKQESERKLEATENNLLRINDIVVELENSIEPLEKQAESARKYLSYREQLKEIEVSVFLEGIDRLKERIKETDDNIALIHQNINQENEKLTEKTERNKESIIRLKHLEEQVEELTREYYEFETALEKFNSEININNEKVNNSAKNTTRILGELSVLENRKEEINIEIKEKQSQIIELSKKMELDNSELLLIQEKYIALVETLDSGEKHIEELNLRLVEKINAQTELKLKSSQNQNNIDKLNERHNNISNDNVQLEIDKKFAEEKRQVSDKTIEKLTFQINFNKERSAELINEHNGLKTTLFEQEKRLNQIKNDIHIKSSRKKMLSNMEANLEGYYRSVRELLQQCEKNSDFARGIHGALAKLIEVSGNHATAIEMSLSGALQNVVTSTEEDAKRAIEYLKKNRFGRATFLPISSVKGRRLEESILSEAKKMPGFIGLASDLIKYDAKYEGIIFNLLGRVVVAENLDSAIAIAKKFNYSFRIVTLEGDVLSTSGSMAGGSNDSKDSGILNRSAEIHEISLQVTKLANEEMMVANNIVDIKNMLKEIEEETREIESIIRTEEHTKIREESQRLQILDSIAKLDEKLLALKNEINNFDNILLSANNELKVAIGAINTSEKEIEEIRLFISANQDKHKEERTGRESFLNDITEFKVKINSLKESIENNRITLGKLLVEMDVVIQKITAQKEEIRIAEIDIEKIKKSNAITSEKIKETDELKSQKSIALSEKSKEKNILEESSSDLISVLQQINNTILLLNEEQGRLAVKKSKADSELEVIQNRMWDEYELTYNNALPLKKEVENMAMANRQINELRNQIKALGPVNVAAIDEYIKTKERYDFLRVQKEDLDSAKEKLHKLIDEMTVTMKKQFIEQFKIINENFNVVFKELFEGGKAELILQDMNNVLESPIEIEVQPPGKKLQSMMLLSGGERAFTAIALLFAILKLRPAPFCLLDEIEAALDDANVYKFSQYIKKHTYLMQFLVITHRKGTMESSDSLYGVTMQEQGISNIVSLKLGDKSVD